MIGATAVSAASDLTVAWPLAALLVLVGLQRLWELRRSARNARRIAALGGVEHGRRHFPLFVALHSLLPLALAGEVWLGGTRPWPTWPFWLGVLLAAQALRLSAIQALGERWNVRIWVLPGAAPVRHGPYRWLRHPNYLAVTLEMVAIPLIFGAWRTAIAASLLNAVALAIRIPTEERALREAAAVPIAPPRAARSTSA